MLPILRPAGIVTIGQYWRSPIMNHKDLMTHTHGLLRAVLLSAAAVTLAGCGAGIARTSVSSATTTVANPSPTPASSAIANVTVAEQAALKLFDADPSLSGHWDPCSNSNNWAACPMSAAVKMRLADLTSKGYFADGAGCGEEYISGTQNGLNNAPTVLSGIAGGNDSVTVVIQRGSLQPYLSAFMTKENGTWLASDLASGSGAAASIFSAKPNC